MKVDFEEWSRLCRHNPRLFERRKRVVLRQAIADARDEAGLQSLLAKLEQIERAGADPLYVYRNLLRDFQVLLNDGILPVLTELDRRLRAHVEKASAERADGSGAPGKRKR